MVVTQISSRDFQVTDAIRADVRSYVAKLEKFYRRLERCEVTISTPHRHSKKGKIFHVSICLRMPGPELAVSREAEKDLSHENLRLALHDAFRALGRRLEDQVRERRGFVRHVRLRPDLKGKVTQVFPEQDYGFVATEDGLEVYFHRNSFKGGSLDRLAAGTLVSFRVEEGEKGPHATVVRKPKKGKRAA